MYKESAHMKRLQTSLGSNNNNYAVRWSRGSPAASGASCGLMVAAVSISPPSLQIAPAGVSVAAKDLGGDTGEASPPDSARTITGFAGVSGNFLHVLKP